MQHRSLIVKSGVRAIVALLAFVVPLELALRLFPGAIPLSLLAEFEPGLRSAIARQRKLQRVEDTIVVPRDDGGPADRMWIYKPHVEVTDGFDEPGMVATMRTDDGGFCNPDPQAFANAERIDVAAIGDSFTWCTSVEPAAAWPAQLALRTGLRVYNFGMPGRGLHEYVQTLKTFALKKKPRFVVLAVYEGNDLRDAVRFHEGKAVTDPQAQRPCPFGSPTACSWHESLKSSVLGRHSYAVNVALATAWRLAYDRSKRQIDFRYDIGFPDGATATFNSSNGDLDEVTIARGLVRDEVPLAIFDEPLAELVALGRTYSYTPIVVYIPSAYTAYNRTVRFHEPELQEMLRRFSDLQRQYFASQAAKIGYRYLDLTPALQQAAARLPSTQPLYFRTNVHLTQVGHEVVAQEIAEDVAGG